jgi:hypothetical protein
VVGLIVAMLVGSVAPKEAALTALVVPWIVVGIVVARVLYGVNYRDAKKFNDSVYRPQKAIWDRSIMCMRCGTVTERPRTTV